MGKTKKILMIIILTTMMMLGANVYAAGNSFKATVTPTTGTLKPGEEITITVAVSDINMGENGINALESTIKYDSNIFESVKASDIQSFNNWSTTYNDEASSLNGKFLAVNLSAGIKEDMNIQSVTFKVKEDIAQTTTTQIDFKDVTSNDGKDLVNVGTKSVKLTINAGDKQPVTPPVTEAPGKLPQTGESMVVTLAMVTIALVGLGVAIKYKKMKDIR